MSGSLRIRSTFLQPDWSSVAQEVASIVRAVQRANDALGFRHLWHLGPEARVSLTAGGMSSSYGGSLLHLCQGLATWLRSPADDFLWPGESVWQTPDVAIAPGDDGGVTLELGYLPAHRLHTTTDELTREIEQLLRDTATAYREHCPAIARVTDMWWLADQSLEDAADGLLANTAHGSDADSMVWALPRFDPTDPGSLVTADLADRVLALLGEWEAGRIDEHEVLGRSDSLLAEAVSHAEAVGALEDGVPREDRFETTLVWILDDLSMLYASGVQSRDVPALRASLSTAAADPVQGRRDSLAYWGRIDVDTRARENHERLQRPSGIERGDRRGAGMMSVVLVHLALLVVTVGSGLYLASVQPWDGPSGLLSTMLAIEAAVLASCAAVMLRLRAWVRHGTRWPLVAADILLGLVAGYVLIPLAFTDGMASLVAILLLAVLAAGVAAVAGRRDGPPERAASVIASSVAAGVAIAAATLAALRLYS